MCYFFVLYRVTLSKIAVESAIIHEKGVNNPRKRGEKFGHFLKSCGIFYEEIIGNLSTLISKKVSGVICGYMDEIGITIASLTSTNKLILAIPAASEMYCQVSAGQSTTLYNNGVIPIVKAGVLHVVRPSQGGRCLVEFFTDNNKHFHYETPNVSTTNGDWYVDTSTKV